jgi:hypothetical protein
MDRLITSPNTSHKTKNTIFLAGGISNCPDWQTPVAEKLLANTDYTIFNPRRKDWNIDDEADEAQKQIIWEHEHLARSETILFWFPQETLCPITLLEYGKFLVSNRKLVVGTHLDYQRRFDVEVQGNLERPGLYVWSDLDLMVKSIFTCQN